MTEEGSRFLDKEALQRYKEYLVKEERAKATVDKYLHDVRVFEAFVRREQSCEADWNSAADTSRKAVTKEKVIEFKHNRQFDAGGSQQLFQLYGLDGFSCKAGQDSKADVLRGTAGA